MSADPSGKDAAIEAYVDALDHIVRVCHASRTQTRRLRWIEARAKGAIEGNQDWRDLDIPPSADSQSKRVLNLIGQREELSSKLSASQAQSAAYEARIKRLEEALRRIQEWDCLNPPDPSLCADHPWLKRLVDEALTSPTPARGEPK